MNDNESELIKLLKDFINENKEDKKETLKCLTELKKQLAAGEARMASIEGLCAATKDFRVGCLIKQDDVEKRLRVVETVSTQVKNLPNEFRKLTFQVYLSAGAMTVIIILAGIWIKGFGA